MLVVKLEVAALQIIHSNLFWIEVESQSFAICKELWKQKTWVE